MTFLLWSGFLSLSFVATTCSSAKLCNDSLTERDLFLHIFKDYNKEVRPVRNASHAIKVDLRFLLSTVHDLVERENTIIIDGFLYTEWHDDYLKWDTTFPDSCIESLVVPSDIVWLPDVALVNSPVGMYSLTASSNVRAWISNDGTVFFEPGGEIVAMCEVDITYFPFDRQVCRLIFESWCYDVKREVFSLRTNSPFIRTLDWTENQQWFLEGNSSLIYFKPGSGDDRYTYHRAMFSLFLRRKSLFYCVNIIIPGVIISLVEVAVFFLPLEEVIKIHVSFTCLLAYSFFQGMVIADLPRSGESVCLLIFYIDLQMAYIGFIALMGDAFVYLIVRKSRSTKKNLPPEWILRYAFCLGRLLLIDHDLAALPKTVRRSGKQKVGVKNISHLGVVSLMFADSAKSHFPTLPSTKSGDFSFATDFTEDKTIAGPTNDVLKESRKYWMFLAKVLDRLCMVLYIAATVVTPLVLFNMRPAYKPTAESGHHN